MMHFLLEIIYLLAKIGKNIVYTPDIINKKCNFASRLGVLQT